MNNDAAAAALDPLGLVLTARMHERVIYADTFAHGETAFEIEPNGIAARETMAIWTEVKGKLGDQT